MCAVLLNTKNHQIEIQMEMSEFDFFSLFLPFDSDIELRMMSDQFVFFPWYVTEKKGIHYDFL